MSYRRPALEKACNVPFRRSEDDAAAKQGCGPRVQCLNAELPRVGGGFVRTDVTARLKSRELGLEKGWQRTGAGPGFGVDVFAASVDELIRSSARQPRAAPDQQTAYTSMKSPARVVE